MRYLICGGNSRSGRLIARSLAEKVSAEDIVFVTTTPNELADWTGKGARAVFGGYNDRASLDLAFAGGGVLILNNCLEIRSSTEQHRNIIAAAKGAGVEHLVYTSSVGAHPRNPRPSVATHVATERMLWESGLPFTVMRNQLYSEFAFHWGVDMLMRVGKCYILGDGNYCYTPAARRDIMACAAEIMLDPKSHDRVIYEISGMERFSLRDLAHVAGDTLKIPVKIESVNEAQIREMFESNGVPREGDPSSINIPFLLGWHELVNIFVSLEQGFFDVQSSHLQMILGRPPIGIEEVFRAKMSSSPVA